MSIGERPRTWQQAERRALVADLVRTQRTLQARSEQLQALLSSRWYRLARFSWRLRRGSVFRKAGPPRMAGEDSFVRSLNGNGAVTADPVVRLVPVAGGGVGVDLERQRWLAGARMPGLEELRVAAILDEETEACLAPECDLDCGFGAGDWRERLEAQPPHLLLVESAWMGNGGGWTGALAPHPGSPQAGLPALRELIAWCRERGIPSAFWATRDPLGFDRFAAAAALFDHVFTVDADYIPAYRQLPGIAAGTVGALPLGAQPRLHNPVAGATGERLAEPAFLGPYEHGWPGEQRRKLDLLLDAAQPLGLVVYERLPYAQTADAYKHHAVFLSANPAAASPTALPRQVFELLACETAVLSTSGGGLAEILGDLVPVAGTREEATEQLERLLGDEGERRRLTERGRRHVLAAHTYRDRLAELVTAVGFDVPAGAGEETAVLLVAGEGEELGEAVDSLLGQSLAPNEVLLGLAGAASADRELDRLVERFPGARIRRLPQDGGAARSERLRELARLAAAPWVVPVAPALRYGPHHLRDLVACTRFADAQVIGFGGAATGGGPHRYTDAVPPYAALAARELVASRGWPPDEAAMRRWCAAGIRIYAGDEPTEAGRR
jgi:Glycosyl transferases group 1